MGNLYKKKDLTSEEKALIKYVKKVDLITPDNSPIMSDPRMYIMNILCYTFAWTDEEVASLLERERTTVLSGRKKAYDKESVMDALFIEHTKLLRGLFPNLKIKKNKGRVMRKWSTAFYCYLSQSRKNKLKKFRDDNNLKSYPEAVAELIDKYL